jgi:hypothetical protein
MTTANEDYQDAALRHQVGVRRYSAGLLKRISKILELADRDLAEKLRTRLARFEGMPLDVTSARWKELLADIRGMREVAMANIQDLTYSELQAFAALEAVSETAMLTASIPIEVSFAAVAPEQLRAITSSRPFQGRLLKDWFGTLEQGDQIRLKSAIQLGMSQGEPVDDIVRRVIGTRKNNYADGIQAITRRDAQSVVRTAVNHVSNTARGYVWEENSDIITAKIWVSTLDGRTSDVCMDRDGRGTPVAGKELPPDVPPLTPAGATPPAHINCRSVMVAYIDGIGLLGNRPFVTDTRTRKDREVDFRAQAKQRGVPIQQVRQEWAAKNIGSVPAKTNYQEFLKRQPASFQDEVLGVTKGKLFRSGDLEVSNFVDRAGNEQNLKQLASRYPGAFEKAGLDPTQF